MPVYAVERLLPGVTLETVERIESAAHQMARTFVAQGSAVRYLGGTFIPGESRCQSFFEATNADLVQDLNDAAQLPYTRIVLAVGLPRDPSIEGLTHTILIPSGEGPRKEL